MNRALSTSTETWPEQALPKHWIESLFSKMLFEYGKKFSDQWGGADPEGLKLHWAQRLAGLSNDELKRGVAALSGREWPPTLPEFIKLCRPSVDATVAYYEAVNGVNARERGEMGEWTHPAIFWASAKMAYDLKNLSYATVKARWERMLQEEMEKDQWADIPQPSLALPAPGKADLSREKAAQMLAELGASGVLKPSGDDKQWARMIMQRVADNDPTLSALQVRFAREALTGKAA